MTGNGKRLYRDKDQGKIAGVCAGVADYLGWDVAVVRVIWVVLSFVEPPVMIGAYILMAWLVDARPSSRFDAGGYASSSYSSSPDAATPRPRFTDVKVRFDRLEGRLRALESIVTSREYQIDRELRNTGRT